MIGIIGFGRFGSLTSRYLSRDFEVTVYDRGGKGADIRDTGALPASLEAVICGPRTGRPITSLVAMRASQPRGRL